MGRHTKRGGYFIEWEKVRAFVVPDLTDFKVPIHHFQESNELPSYNQMIAGLPSFDRNRKSLHWNNH